MHVSCRDLPRLGPIRGVWPHCTELMSGYTNFAVVGAGNIGSYIVRQLLKDKAAGIIKEVVVLSRQVKYPSND